MGVRMSTYEFGDHSSALNNRWEERPPKVTPVLSQIFMDSGTRMEMRQKQTKIHAHLRSVQQTLEGEMEITLRLREQRGEAVSKHELWNFCLLGTRKLIPITLPLPGTLTFLLKHQGVCRYSSRLTEKEESHHETITDPSHQPIKTGRDIIEAFSEVGKLLGVRNWYLWGNGCGLFPFSPLVSVRS